MDKENSRSAAGLRRSAMAERLRLREEWSELIGTTSQQPTSKIKKTVTNILAKRQMERMNADKKKLRDNNQNVSQTVRDKPMHIQSDELNGVVALVSVGVEGKALALRAALGALGASVVGNWSPLVTHLVWAHGGCRSTRAKARALGCRVTSPLWVEACAAANKRLPEQAFPAAARPSDLPSPRTLRQLLKRAEMENVSLFDLLSDSKEQDQKTKNLRLRLSSETDMDTSEDKTADTSGDRSKDTSDDTIEPESRVNTAPRRALPVSMTPQQKKSRRKLFTNREVDEKRSGDESDEPTPTVPKRINLKQTTPSKRDLARAERMARKLVASSTPAPNKTNAQNHLRPRIVLTGMSRAEKQIVTNAIRSLNGKIQKTVDRRTTHVLLGSCTSSNATVISNFNVTGINTLQTIDSVKSMLPVSGVLSSKIKDRRMMPLSGVLNAKTKDRTMLPVSGVLSSKNLEDRVVLPLCEVEKARTLNCLLGAVRGCRILYAQWAIDSMLEKRWIHHYGYEVQHLRKISQKARIERTALNLLRSDYAYDVFNGMRVFVSQNSDQREAALQLLTLGGAVIANQDGGQNADMKIGRENDEVNSKWVFDSVAASRMRNTRRYLNERYMEINGR